MGFGWRSGPCGGRRAECLTSLREGTAAGGCRASTSRCCQALLPTLTTSCPPLPSPPLAPALAAQLQRVLVGQLGAGRRPVQCNRHLHRWAHVRARAWLAGCGGCLAGWLAGMPAAAVGTGSSQASWASRASGSRGPGRVCPPPHLALLLPVFLPSPSTHPALLAAFLPPPPPHWALLAVFLPPPGRHVDRAPLWQQALQLARAEPAADTAGQGATGPGSVHPCHLGPARLGHLQIPHPPAAVLLPGWARVQVVWVGEGAVLVLRACGLGELVGWGGSRAFRPPHKHALSCSDRPSPPGVPTHLPCRGDHPAAV